MQYAFLYITIKSPEPLDGDVYLLATVVWKHCCQLFSNST